MMRTLLKFLVLSLCCCLWGGGFAAAADPAHVGGLPAALTATLSHHPAIKGKLAELSSQGYRVDTAKAGRYPNLSGEVSQLDDGDEFASLRLRQPLWAFGKIDTSIDLAKTRLRVEYMALLQVQRQLLEQTAAAYARVQGINMRLLVSRDNIAELERLYKRVERRKAGQLASAADVQMAFSRLAQAQSQKERIVGEVQIAKAELLALTQREVGSEEAVDPVLSKLPGRSMVESLALEQHADIRYKQKLVDVARYNVKLEKISSTPTLYAEVTRDFFDSSNANDTRAGLSFEGNLDGVGLGILGRVRSASAQVDAARQDLSSTRNDVELRVDSLLTNLALQTRLQRAQQASVDAVRDTRESFFRQYESGRKTWLEVLNIQRELTEQLLQLVQADSDWLILSLRLAALTGQLDMVAGLESLEME